MEKSWVSGVCVPFFWESFTVLSCCVANRVFLGEKPVCLDYQFLLCVVACVWVFGG